MISRAGHTVDWISSENAIIGLFLCNRGFGLYLVVHPVDSPAMHIYFVAFFCCLVIGTLTFRGGIASLLLPLAT